MAEELVNRVVADLGESAAGTDCRTAAHRLVGCPAEEWETFRERTPRELSNRFRLDEPVAAHLVDRYGCQAITLLDEFANDAPSCQPIVAGEPDIRAELQFQAAREMAVQPSDHLLRRMRLGLFHPELLSTDLNWPTLNRFGTLTT
jgi:glycerol-3-phosphate dehydrogenase